MSKQVDLINLAEKVDSELGELYKEVDRIAFTNHKKVLAAFQKARVSDYHFQGSTGYGYGDQGRETLEKVYSLVFNTEAALVRGQIVSGTHALAICMYGILRPGDELLFVQGTPYDTLEEVIGIRGDGNGSLLDYGVTYKQVETQADGHLDYPEITAALGENTKLLLIQRSCGYSLKPSLCVSEIQRLIAHVKNIKPGIIVMVDNCYGEMVEEREPTDVGADIVAGSLIKNPGGGIAPTGGYVAGKKNLVEMSSNRWTAPGVGNEVGPVLDWQRLFYQGLFLAPHTVAEALKGAVFSARFFEKLGFEVFPRHENPRTDIIQAIKLGSPERVVAFCQGLQKGSPVDSYVLPEPWGMPGYGDKVIMAAGTFVQGASLELTADGPIRPPYAVYMQGGLSKEYVKLGAISAAREVLSC
ncbi:MAG TPA: methionine gamma-lyase family protein [Clostridia bacterium]|nr:methionine gamma-lyase family protein [Clostridia bacterium]